MSKIPKNRSDKEMLAGWVEDTSIEDQFLKAEKKARQAKPKQADDYAPPAEFRQAGFHPALMQELSKQLLQLRLQLAQKGATHFTYTIKREGENIVIKPQYRL
ncbi:MAG: hypothetical protein MR866_02315 [Selenomonadaceae bacterium]|nr:hypothetical protein [Selenomonadaceae bacterium]